MKSKQYSPNKTVAWRNLEALAQDSTKTTIADLFKSETDRAEKMSVEVGGIVLDFSKNLVDLYLSIAAEDPGLLLYCYKHVHAIFKETGDEAAADLGELVLRTRSCCDSLIGSATAVIPAITSCRILKQYSGNSRIYL